MAETKESYCVNPNQKTYCMCHRVDHLVEVKDIYFAEKVKKYKWTAQQKTFALNPKSKITEIKTKHQKALKVEKKIIQNLVAVSIENPKEELVLGWQEREDDGFEFIKINKTRIGEKIFIVAICSGDNGKLSIEINENKWNNEEFIYKNPLKFLIADQEQTKIEFSILKDKIQYEQEIQLREKNEDTLKKLTNRFKDKKNKKTYIFLNAQVTDTKDEIKFINNNSVFCNEEQSRFEVLNIQVPWMEIVLEEAKIYGGYSEGGNNILNKRIKSAYFSIPNEGANSKSNPKTTSWCATFASWCLQKAGYANPSTCRALEFDTTYVFEGPGKEDKKLSHMIKIDKPVYGCIVVWRNTGKKGGGHVAFYFGQTSKGTIIPLGGNQGSSLQFSDRDPKGDYGQKVVGYFLPEDYITSIEDEFTKDQLSLDPVALNKSGLLAQNGSVSGNT